MKFSPKDPPRKFIAGGPRQIQISDCGSIELSADEQVTFTTNAGRQYDVAKKNWGFYATPSVNGRLSRQGFKTALVRNSDGRRFVMIVEPEFITDFHSYLDQEKCFVEEWLDEG